MVIQSPRRLEKRWTRLRKLAAAQLADLKTDQKMIARQSRQYKLKKDGARVRGAIAHSKQLQRAVAATSRFIAAKDRVVKEATRRENC